MITLKQAIELVNRKLKNSVEAIVSWFAAGRGVTLKQAIELVNRELQNSKYEYYRSKRATSASEFKKGWWIGFPDIEWGGLFFVVKKTGQVLWGNPPPLEYIDDEPRKVPDDEFHNAAGY